MRDATNRQTTLGYENADSLPDAVTGNAGKLTRFEYFGSDLTSVRGPLGNMTRFFVDSVGHAVG